MVKGFKVHVQKHKAKVHDTAGLKEKYLTPYKNKKVRKLYCLSFCIISLHSLTYP